MFEDNKKTKTNQFSTMRQLPVHSLYHMHNYSSDKNWTAYQVSLNEVRLIRYNQNIAIRESFAFQFPTEPIKQIKVIVDEDSDIAYLAVLFLTKYIIYKNNTELCSYRLKLDRNIVVFQNSFVSCDATYYEKQIFFTFLTSTGEIHHFSMNNIANKLISNFTSDARFCSVKALSDNIVLGNQKGKLLLVNLKNQSLLKSFDTGSQMPILQIKQLDSRVIVGTCQGEIFNLSEDLTSFTSLSAHQGLICHLEIGDGFIYTFGDDGVLNVFEMDKNSKDLKLRKSTKYEKRANMILTINSLTFLNFYQEITLEEITQA